MDVRKLLKFDVTGTLAENRVLGEKQPIKDKTCPWIIPDGSPFFGEKVLVTVYDARGAEMTRDKDYWVEEEFAPFCAATGRSIKCFIRLSEEILKNNAFVKLDYQTLGAFFFPRSSLEDWLAKIQDTGPLDYSKIIGLPETFPGSHHFHSIITEIGDWYELTYFFKVLTAFYRTRDPSVGTDADKVINDAFAEVMNLKKNAIQRLNDHDANYKAPHAPSKTNLNLGNVANNATATVEEDVQGTRNDLYSTVLGVQQMVKRSKPDDSILMKTGIVPVSKYGGQSFIPPNISGSFEGLGSNSLSSAMCMEKNGLFMMLTGHNDGRNEGLYYSQVTDFGQTSAKITYTGYKYQPPSLLARNFNPTTVISGSNHRIIMVGNPKTPEWYLSLTNGTLDANAHQYTKLDMTEVDKIVPASLRNREERMSIHLIGKYAILQCTINSNYLDALAFFRIPISALTGGTAKWQHLLVSYTDYDDTVFTNAPSLIATRPVASPKGGWDRYGPWSFKQPAMEINRTARTAVLSTTKEGSSTTGVITTLMTGNVGRTENSIRILAGTYLHNSYEFNAETGVFTQLQKPTPFTFDFTEGTQAQRDAYSSQHYGHLYDMANQGSTASCIILPTGEIAISTGRDQTAFPAYLTMIAYQNRKSDYDVITQPMDRVFAPLQYQRLVTPIVSSPLISGTFPGSLTYDAEGEFYAAVDLKTNVRKLFYRKVSGEYADRPELTNLFQTNVKGRPLSSQVFATNLSVQESLIGLTGSEAELKSGGVECGSTSFSAMSYSSMGAAHNCPFITEFKAPAENKMLLSCPRTIKSELDTVKKTADYAGDTFFGIRQALVDKFRLMIPEAYRNSLAWSVSFYLLRNEAGGMFRSMNLGFASIMFHDPVRSQVRGVVVLFKPVIENPNADHPSCYWVKDVEILDTSVDYRVSVNVRTPEQHARAPAAIARSTLYLYKDGDTIQGYLVSPYSSNTTTSYITRQYARFNIDTANNKLTDITMAGGSWSLPDFTFPIPKVGFSDATISGNAENGRIGTPGFTVFEYTGGAARLARKTLEDGTMNWYIGPTVYPETGWTLFFQESVPFMINGVGYTISGGSVDLRDIDPSPGGKTFYIYATIEDGEPKYVFSLEKLRKRSGFIPAGVVVTNLKQILTIERLQPFMIGQYTLSYSREGGTIPMSVGFPQDEGDFVFLSRAELLP